MNSFISFPFGANTPLIRWEHLSFCHRAWTEKDASPPPHGFIAGNKQPEGLVSTSWNLPPRTLNSLMKIQKEIIPDSCDNAQQQWGLQARKGIWQTISVKILLGCVLLCSFWKSISLFKDETSSGFATKTFGLIKY